jgi:hypothetical protein
MDTGAKRLARLLLAFTLSTSGPVGVIVVESRQEFQFDGISYATNVAEIAEDQFSSFWWCHACRMSSSVKLPTASAAQAHASAREAAVEHHLSVHRRG